MACMCVFLCLPSCYVDKGDKLYPNPYPCDTSNVRFSSHINNIISRNCLACHNSTTPSGGYNFESYSSFIACIGGNRLVNAINYRSGGGRNMPPSGQLGSCDIQRIEAWIKQGYPNN